MALEKSPGVIGLEFQPEPSITWAFGYNSESSFLFPLIAAIGLKPYRSNWRI